MTYRNERLELEVKVTKGLMNYSADESTTRKFTLRSDSPLFVANSRIFGGYEGGITRPVR